MITSVGANGKTPFAPAFLLRFACGLDRCRTVLGGDGNRADNIRPYGDIGIIFDACALFEMLALGRNSLSAQYNVAFFQGNGRKSLRICR